MPAVPHTNRKVSMVPICPQGEYLIHSFRLTISGYVEMGRPLRKGSLRFDFHLQGKGRARLQDSWLEDSSWC